MRITKLICEVENNLVYLWGILVRSMIVIVSWAIENNLVYLRSILTWSLIVIVFRAIENNLEYLRSILVCNCDNFWAIENKVSLPSHLQTINFTFLWYHALFSLISPSLSRGILHCERLFLSITNKSTTIEPPP